MTFKVDTLLDQIEGMMSEWDVYAKTYTDEQCLKEFGKTKLEGEEVQITNHMMETMVKLIKAVRDDQKDQERTVSRFNMEKRRYLNDIEYWKERALMSDRSISDLVQEYIDWADSNDGQESLQWTDVKLLEIVRNRMRG